MDWSSQQTKGSLSRLKGWWKRASKGKKAIVIIGVLSFLLAGCSDSRESPGYYEGDMTFHGFDYRIANDSGQTIQFDLSVDGREACRMELRDHRVTGKGECVPKYLKGALDDTHALSIHVRYQDGRERSEDFSPDSRRLAIVVGHFQVDLKEGCYDDPKVARPTCPSQ